MPRWIQKVYSGMQSDGNSFGGDVVFKSVNMASCYEDSILDQITELWNKELKIGLMCYSYVS